MTSARRERPGDALDAITYSGDELLALGAEETPCVVEGLLARGDFALLSGREKIALKTWLALDLAVAMRTGGTWLGRAVERCDDPVLIVSETRPSIIARRMTMLSRGRGVDVREVMGGVDVTGDAITVMPVADLNRISAEAAEKARRSHARDSVAAAVAAGHRAAVGGGRNVLALLALLEREWSLVILDTVRMCMAGDENSSEAAARFTAGAREIAQTTGAIVLAAHHTGKGSVGGDSRSARGSVELTAGPDALLTVDADGSSDPRVHYTLRAREAPDAQAYRLVTGGDDGAEWARITTDVVADAPKRRDAEAIESAVLGALRIEREMTATQLRSAVGVSGARMADVLAGLLADRRITRRRALRHGKRVEVYAVDPRGASWAEVLGPVGPEEEKKT